jgi:hypothetical protein
LTFRLVVVILILDNELMNWSLFHWENSLLRWYIYESGSILCLEVYGELYEPNNFKIFFPWAFQTKIFGTKGLKVLVFAKPGVVLRSANSEGVHWAGFLGLIGQLTRIEEDLPNIYLAIAHPYTFYMKRPHEVAIR